MKNKPLKIDEISIEDHFFLALGHDECYYFGSYYKDYNSNPDNDNSIIFNIKKKPSTSNLPSYVYKTRDIAKVASIFNNAFSDEVLSNVTFVPIPPSKIKGHADYDDRMTQILNLAFKGRQADIRELVEQINSIVASHESQSRPTIQEIESNTRIDEKLTSGLNGTIFLVDDVITTGAHFKAIKNVLIKRFPEIKVVGIFICRRVIEHNELDLF